MPLVAAAVCPFPPLLVPEISAGAAAEVAPLLAACDAAVAHLARAGARRLVVVGADTVTREYTGPFRGSFGPWGVAIDVDLGGTDDPPDPQRLPLSLLVGTWLLRRRLPWGSPVGWRMFGVDQAADPGECLGSSFRSDAPTALLVLGDGSACRGRQAPGYDDPRAEPYDAAVSRALADVDLDALAALDRELSAELQVTGRAPWQVLAGAVRDTGGAWRGEVTYDAAPYGVGYLVATWSRG